MFNHCDINIAAVIDNCCHEHGSLALAHGGQLYTVSNHLACVDCIPGASIMDVRIRHMMDCSVFGICS